MSSKVTITGYAGPGIPSVDKTIYGVQDISFDFPGNLVSIRTGSVIEKYGISSVANIAFNSINGGYAVTISEGEGSPEVITLVTDLTADELNNLNSASPIVVPAPADNEYIDVLSVSAYTPTSDIPVSIQSVTLVREGSTNGLVEPFAFTSGDIIGSGIDSGGTFDEIDDALGKAVTAYASSDYEKGAILTSSLGDGGSDYAANDTFTVDGGVSGHLATGIVNTVSVGVVTAYTITAGGAGYSVSADNDTTATLGIGTGLKIDVDSITAADATARIYVTYQVLTAPSE